MTSGPSVDTNAQERVKELEEEVGRLKLKLVRKEENNQAIAASPKTAPTKATEERDNSTDIQFYLQSFKLEIRDTLRQQLRSIKKWMEKQLPSEIGNKRSI